MSDRVTLQNAIGDASNYDPSQDPSYVDGKLDMLRAVQSGDIVTAERAALETMAEQDCVQNVAGDLKTCCEYYQQSSDWCPPCWARHVIGGDT